MRFIDIIKTDGTSKAYRQEHVQSVEKHEKFTRLFIGLDPVGCHKVDCLNTYEDILQQLNGFTI